MPLSGGRGCGPGSREIRKQTEQLIKGEEVQNYSHFSCWSMGINYGTANNN